jgi:hypothetical protein
VGGVKNGARLLGMAKASGQPKKGLRDLPIADAVHHPDGYAWQVHTIKCVAFGMLDDGRRS